MCFPVSLMNEWKHDYNRNVDQVMGACMMSIRRSVFQDLNGFDERFFVYFEEVDLCLRCKQLGWDVHFLSDASAIHSGGGCSRQVPGKRLYYSLKSRILYGLKHFSRRSAAALCFATFFLEPVSRTVLALAHRSAKEVWNTMEAYRLLWLWVSSRLPTADDSRFSVAGDDQVKLATDGDSRSDVCRSR